MADLTVTAARVAPIFPRHAEIYPFVAAATITAGQVVYVNSAGKVDLADANGSGTLQVRGVALNGAVAGGAVDVLKRGHVAGYTLSQAYDAQLFVSNTAGAIADAAGGSSIPVGRVVPMSDVGTLTKVVYVDCPWATAQYS